MRPAPVPRAQSVGLAHVVHSDLRGLVHRLDVLAVAPGRGDVVGADALPLVELGGASLDADSFLGSCKAAN